MIGQIWSIVERKFSRDWKRNMIMFHVLVKSILMYGVETWGLEEREKSEALQIKYIR